MSECCAETEKAAAEINNDIKIFAFIVLNFCYGKVNYFLTKQITQSSKFMQEKSKTAFLDDFCIFLDDFCINNKLILRFLENVF